jgi:integrase
MAADNLAEPSSLPPRALPVAPATALATLDAETLAPAEIAAALRFAGAAKAANTRRAYAADWADFCRWAATRGADPLPCPPGLLCGYLAALADAGRRAATITRRAAAIAHQHRAAGCDPPTASPAVREVLRGIRHTLGTAPGGKAPATADLIARMLAACPETLIGRRDRALLAFGFAGAFRRSELLALEVGDLTEVGDGLRVLIRRSKTDPEAHGQEIAIPRGSHLRPVEILQAWLAPAGISDGPLFRSVSKGGRIGTTPLGADGFVRALKRRAAAAGLDPREFAGHSLRAGFLTCAAEAGADALKMAEVSRHKSLDTLRRYVRRSNLFQAHAGAGFL